MNFLKLPKNKKPSSLFAGQVLLKKKKKAALLRGDSLTAVYIKVPDINTVPALEPFGVLSTASLIKEPLNRLRHDLESRVLRPAKPAAA